jgi:hypothetical protein
MSFRRRLAKAGTFPWLIDDDLDEEEKEVEGEGDHVIH